MLPSLMGHQDSIIGQKGNRTTPQILSTMLNLVLAAMVSVSHGMTVKTDAIGLAT